MKKHWTTALMLAMTLSLSLAPGLSEAKRLGGGGSSGMQRAAPPHSAPTTPPARPAQPTQAAPTPASPTPAAPGKRSWLGPIAGLAAGLGIAALMSHFGLGEGLGTILTIALLAIAAVFLVRFLMQRFGGGRMAGPQTVPAGAAGSGAPAGGAQVAWPRADAPATVAPIQRSLPEPLTTSSGALGASDASGVSGAVNAYGQPISGASTAASAAAPTAAPTLPADFDRQAFERIAKMIFLRMQAANDNSNLDDLRQFTTPEMFASFKLDLLDRGSKPQVTEVLRVDAEVLELARESGRQIVSVRYHGAVREEAGAAPVDFDEVWHLVNQDDGGGPWLIAGIQQRQ